MSPRLRVLHAIHDFLPRHQAGSELYAAALASALQRRGHHMTVLAAAFDPSRTQGELTWRSWAGVPVVEVVNNWTAGTFDEAWRPVDVARALDAVLEAVDPQVLHVHNLLNLSLDLPARAKQRGIAVAGTLHDYTLVCPSGGQRIHKAERHICRTIDVDRCARCFGQSPQHAQLAFGRALRAPGGRRAAGLARAISRAAPWLTRRLVAAAGRAASEITPDPAAISRRLDRAREAFEAFDYLAAPSASLAGEFAALGFPTARVHVRDNGFVRLAPVTRHREAQAPLRVGYLGTIVWHKGVHVLVEAIRRLPKEHVEALVFGDLAVAPDYAAELQSAAAGLPVRFRGRFEHGDIARVLEEIDVVVVPSIWLENSPLVIHEAFMARVPVVAADIGGIADLVQHDVNGLLYPPESPDALAALLKRLAADRTLLDALAARAPDVVEIEADAESWERVYLDLVAAGTSGTPL